MSIIKGTPHAVPFEADGSCLDETVVPGPCAACRQVDRWLARTVGWAQDRISRFGNIMRAILTAHDEVLQSLCGFCAEQDVLTCECFTQQYITLGLPTTIQTSVVPDECLRITRRVTLAVDCYIECLIDCIDCLTIVAPDPSMPTCWDVDCVALCETCEEVVLDPCNNPLHLSMMTRVYDVVTQCGGMRGTGDNITFALSLLFPGTIPQIVSWAFGNVFVTLGRRLTADEQTFLKYLLQFLPLGFGVQVTLVTPCPLVD